MADEANFLPTPENYATPDQLKSAREYAKALMTGAGQQPVKHWTQGVSNMVSALVGGALDYNSAQREKRALERTAMQEQVVIPSQNYPNQAVGTPGAVPLRAAGEQGSPQMFPKTSGTVGAGTPEQNAIAGIESGGKYDLLGPVTKTGDRAYGKYQVMGSNIGPWSKEILGHEVTPEQFLADPKLQDAIFNGKFGQYTQKYGPEGASRAWFAGEGGMNDMGRKDQLGTTVGDYGRRFALAFNQSPQGAAPAEAAIQEAASKTPQMKQPSPGVDVQGGGQSIVNPALVKPQPGYTPQQLHQILSNPWIDPKIKEQAMQLMLQRGQPITMDDPRGTGGKIMIDPNNPGTQQFFAPPPHYVPSEIGDIKTQRPIMIGPDGKPYLVSPQRVAPGMGPRSEAAPTAAPAVAPQGAPAGGATPVVATQNNAPAAPAVPSAAPVQVASNDPTAGFQEAAAKGDAPAAETPLAKMAQAGPPPGVDPEDWAAYTQKKNFDVNKKLDEEAGGKQIEFGAKKYDTLTSQAQTARKLLPQIDLARSLMDDPQFQGGWGHNVGDAARRIKAALLGDANANASNETFDKLMAGNVLDTMKTALGGLGQVRLAEIDLLNRANGTRNNTDASNRAVLEISRRGLVKLDNLAGLSQQYMSGDEVVDPITGQVMMKANIGPDGEVAPRRTLDAGFDKLARKFDHDHPSFTPEEIKNYQTLFEKPKEAGATTEAPKAAGQSQIAVGTEKEFDDGKGGKVMGVWDGKQWGPKK